LNKDPRIEWVSYPGLPEHPYYELAKKQQKKYGAMLSFGIKGGYEAGKKFINSIKLCSHMSNLGDTKSILVHPASTTHQQLSKEARKAAGVTEDMIRFSVGIEDIQDIIDDLDQALNMSQK
jgi:O-acetylhomoserine (thiol)-lyase